MLDSGKVGAVVVWWEGVGWEGRPYYLERNKEVYDAEVYTIYRGVEDLRAARGEKSTIYHLLRLRTASAQTAWG